MGGWETRSDALAESTFSRAFDEFARGDLGDVVHEAMVKTHCGELQHAPVIDSNVRGGKKCEMDPATARRYEERGNANLKDNCAGRYVRVRGGLKTKLHLMFGVIAICATPLVRLLE